MTFHDNCGPVSLGFQPASGYYASGMTTLDSVLVLKVTHVKDKRARRRRRLSFFLHLLWMVRNLWLTKFISNMTKLLRRLPVFSFVSPISFSFNYLWNIERSRVYLPYIELPALYPFIQIELNSPPKDNSPVGVCQTKLNVLFSHKQLWLNGRPELFPTCKKTECLLYFLLWLISALATIQCFHLSAET